jgi:hypothetical protein
VRGRDGLQRHRVARAVGRELHLLGQLRAERVAQHDGHPEQRRALAGEQARGPVAR